MHDGGPNRGCVVRVGGCRGAGGVWRADADGGFSFLFASARELIFADLMHPGRCRCPGFIPLLYLAHQRRKRRKHRPAHKACARAHTHHRPPTRPAARARRARACACACVQRAAAARRRARTSLRVGALDLAHSGRRRARWRALSRRSCRPAVAVIACVCAGGVAVSNSLAVRAPRHAPRERGTGRYRERLNCPPGRLSARWGTPAPCAAR